MRLTAILMTLLLGTSLLAQEQSGRHFQRPNRTVATPPASTAAEATATTTGVRAEPLRRLRSGRAWSAFHFSRRVETPATGTAAVDASKGPEVRRTAFWGRKVRSV